MVQLSAHKNMERDYTISLFVISPSDQEKSLVHSLLFAVVPKDSFASKTHAWGCQREPRRRIDAVYALCKQIQDASRCLAKMTVPR